MVSASAHSALFCKNTVQSHAIFKHYFGYKSLSSCGTPMPGAVSLRHSFLSGFCHTLESKKIILFSAGFFFSFLFVILCIFARWHWASIHEYS